MAMFVVNFDYLDMVTLKKKYSKLLKSFKNVCRHFREIESNLQTSFIFLMHSKN